MKKNRFIYKKSIYSLFLIFYLFMLPVSLYASNSKDIRVLKFGVVPQHSASKIIRLWQPVLNWLNGQTGIKFQVKTAKNIPEFEKALANGVYDYAYMNPYHFTFFNESPGYRASVRQKNKMIHGIIVTHVESPYNKIEDLNGEKLAFPSPAAFAASILPRGNLRLNNIDYTPYYVSSHDSVYLTVSKKLFSAGGGVIRTLNNMPENVRKNLKILWKSKGYTPHAIAAHPRVSKEIQGKIQKAFVAMSDNKEALELLSKLNMKSGFTNSVDSDWDDVKILKINELK